MRQKDRSMGEEVTTTNQSKSKATSKKISSLPELINSNKKPTAPASPGQVRKANNNSNNSKQQKSNNNSSKSSSPTPIIKNGSTSNSTTYKQLTQKKGGSASQRSKSSNSSSSVFQKHHSSNSSSSSSKQQYHANHGHHSHHQASHQQAHHMKSSMSNKGSDVELIVRKKLITTTTTTTMTPIHTPSNNVSAANATSADVAASSNQLNKSQDENEPGADKLHEETSSQVTSSIQKANRGGETTNDEMTHSMSSNLINQANEMASKDDESIVALSPFAQQQQQQQTTSIVNNRLTSTVKKEQLEYEFRLRPRMVVYKSFNNSLNSNCIKRKKGSKKINKPHKGKTKVSEEDENLEGNEDEGDEEEEDEENESGEENVGGGGGGNAADYAEAHGGSSGCTSAARRRRHRQQDSSATRSFLSCSKLRQLRPIACSSCCCSRRKRSDPESDETISSSPPHRQASLREAQSGFMRIILNMFLCCVRSKSEPGELSSGDVQTTALVAKAKKPTTQALEEYVERPPVTCIRVLRPSNDLTPVRFDSHYNIIQAVTNGSISGPSGVAAAPSLPSPPSSDANKTAADVISMMEDAIKQQQAFSDMSSDELVDGDFAGLTKV